MRLDRGIVIDRAELIAACKSGSDGFREYVYGQVYTYQKVVAALGHNPQLVIETPDKIIIIPVIRQRWASNRRRKHRSRKRF